ncbi:hypothetical protein [Pseudoalteromonas sp. Of11M-6]|uniref:hypothetical protein n=1 Tax=Pseudoalteromonas sp. Of11M-6 TaxID=2917754 RepID=UPI001EF4F1C7|nr:hypothetical protein [Pseudoalteromonas sp. Of11M-6]MCG7552800.1 hypothetical protein [Pseudoalteromonas sp. Of11M-6]
MNEVDILIKASSELEAKRILLSLTQAPDLSIVKVEETSATASSECSFKFLISDSYEVDEEE